MQAAYKAEEIPEILRFVEDGSLNLTLINILAPHLRKENAEALLLKCRGKSKREVQAIVAEDLSPAPAARDVVKIIPPVRIAEEPFEQSSLFGCNRAAGGESSAAFAGEPAPPGSSAPLEPPPGPLGEPAVRIGFTASQSFLAKLERAKGLLRHKHPEGRLEQVLDEALDALLDLIDRSRKERPARERPVLPGRRRIPEWVKDEVWRRDRGRCAFETVDGERCQASEWLEFDHVRPFALGGVSDDPDNVQLLCRAHNQHRAHEDFGDPAWTGGTFAPGPQKQGAPRGAAAEPELPLGGALGGPPEP